MSEPELHINCDSDIDPEKRKILVQMFGELYIKAMEESREKRRKLRIARAKEPGNDVKNKTP